MNLPDPSLPWPVPLTAVAMIAEREGCRLRAYRCPAGVWTCGYGETDGVSPGMVWTQAQADQRFCDSLAQRTTQVQALLKEHAEPNQLGALVSLAYNIGTAAFARSSVLKAHNAGDSAAAARAFALFNKARVAGVLQVLPGLTSRRAAEAALYLTPEPDAPRERMPQAVEPQASLAASPTVQASTVTAGAGAVALVAQAREQLGPVGEALQWGKGVLVDLGMPPEAVLPAIALVLGGLVLWRRYAQRQQGLA